MEACNAWAKSHGVDAHKHGVEFRASPLGGMGAFATKAINAGDTLLLLPRGFAVTPYVCEVALQDASLARSPRAALALFLCHERARGAASPWAAWLSTLPAEGLDGSAFGTSADVIAAAAATCVEINILRRVRAESSRRPPRHRRDACSMAWRCRFLAARPSQDGRVIAEK